MRFVLLFLMLVTWLLAGNQASVMANYDQSGSKPISIVKLSAAVVKSLGIELAVAQMKNTSVPQEKPGVFKLSREPFYRVNSLVSGRAVAVLEDVGNKVVNGQPLLTVRSPDIEQAEGELLECYAQLKDDEADQLLQLDAKIKQQEEQVRLSQDNYQRLESLLADKIAAKAVYDQAKTAYEKDQIELDSMKKRRVNLLSRFTEQLDLRINSSKEKLKLLGVSDRSLNQLLSTRQIDPVVTITANANGVIAERLIMVGETLYPSRTLFVIKGPEKSRLVVSSQAVQEVNGEQFLYVSCSQGTFERRRIVTGSVSGAEIEIISGVKPGELVVVKGGGALYQESLKNIHKNEAQFAK